MINIQHSLLINISWATYLIFLTSANPRLLMARPGLGRLALVLLATGCCTVGRMVRDEDSCHQASQALSSHGNNLHSAADAIYLLIYLIQSRLGF